MKLPGGLDIYAVKFTADIHDVALELLPHTRKAVVLPTDAERGSEFNNDDRVLWRLESMFSEDEFCHDPIGTLSAALLDAAKSDHWYTHEKEWDMIQETEDEDNVAEASAYGDDGC